MAATMMAGGELAARIRAEVAEEVRELGELGLATVLVGEDEASQIYIERKHDAAREVGIVARDYRLSTDTSEEELLDLVASLNADEAIDGVLVQLPLPGHVDEGRVIRAVEPVKDVDGFHPFNVGQLYLGQPTHVSATPLGIIALLDEHGVALEGARAVVVGRSEIVGKPVALLLLARNATVTICHSRTRDLAERCREADVLVVATGQVGLVGAGDVKAGAAVVDVGMNRTPEGLRGDVDPAAAELAGLMTPVPGGVGPMTIAMLLRSTVRAARYRRGLLAFPGG
ncbi:MAG TPA: bifunctional 5,10-methylenetetrahydrofolate dehydrogenase/5,10-methenyltetrahydrofolate cyclohydrolase [Gaiellaceae bacterium]|jgi:methylenetetrahydrofolate dehydrogenase (NADP+)/methenyltetrahydrofolate cyclohydrolase|nr:bifunctional 5,10-methylenetetrahydrofolate dehydrogenase/5,10-methenyltetrahydrofolate cyclohydrolase [Gaiellaceae bacterium]